MDRRDFLMTAPTVLAGTTTLGHAATESALADLTVLPPKAMRRGSASSERHGYAVAVFPSTAWGACARGLRFEQGCLTGLDSGLLIREGRFDLGGLEPPEIAIALANPHDTAAWRAAQAQCAKAKQAGALTLLFAAHPSPQYRYPFDSRALDYRAEQDCENAADIVIDFVSAYLLEEFPWVAHALLNFGQFHGRTDVPALRSALGGGNRAVYLWSEARRGAPVNDVTRFARNHLMRLAHAGLRFTGLLALLEGAWIGSWDYDELYTAYQQAMPEYVPLCVECAGILHDEWEIVHTIATYAQA